MHLMSEASIYKKEDCHWENTCIVEIQWNGER